MWQLFHSSSLRIIQPLFQPIDHDLINSLGLSVSLGVGKSGILVCNSQVTIVSPEGLAVKLEAIIRDESVGDLESSNDVLLDKLLSIHIPDIGQEFGFDPFNEIVCADQ